MTNGELNTAYEFAFSIGEEFRDEIGNARQDRSNY